MRMGLKLLRTKNKLSQLNMAEKIGCTRTTYAAIENGERQGSLAFWETLQEVFDIPSEAMWDMMLNEKD